MNHTLEYHGNRENQIAMLSRLGVFREAVEQSPEQLERFPLWGFGNFDRSAKSGEDGDSQKTDHQNTLTVPQGDNHELAKAWLEVNCAVCHRPEGIAPHNRDLRFHTSLENMRLVDEEPSQGQLGPPETLLIKPAEPLLSELYFRISRRGPRQMPPLATRVVDPLGHEVIKRWIAQMPDRPSR